MSTHDVKSGITLVYFSARGVADKIRLLLAEADVNFVEKVVGQEISSKEARAASPFGELPVITLGTPPTSISGDAAIFRHLGRMLALYGATPTEHAAIDMWVDACGDITREMWSSAFMAARSCGGTDYQQSALKQDFVKKYLEPKLAFMDRAFASRSHPSCLVGQDLSIADIALFSMLEAVDKELPLALVTHRPLAEWRASFAARPRIKAFSDSGKRR